MSAPTEIDWDTYEPTKAVRKASDVLFSADSTDAMCFGWVPQAREALDAALNVEEMARVMWEAHWKHVNGEPHGVWADCPDFIAGNYRAMAAALRAAILGGAS